MPKIRREKYDRRAGLPARLIGMGAIVIVVLLVGIGLWKTHESAQRLNGKLYTHRPRRIMGTESTIYAVADARRKAEEIHDVLMEVEEVLRSVESKMSVWLQDSEISRLNAAQEGEWIQLSHETTAVLLRAREAYYDTNGAFDITCSPLVEVWKRAGRQGVLPEKEEIESARNASSWDDFEFRDNRVKKHSDRARVDLGGIAKGSAIDRAIAVLQRHGCIGGLVDIGGDLRCFGTPPVGEGWDVEIRNPFSEGVLKKIQVVNSAVCTSGNYARFSIIDGLRYSHIIDPRTGMPAENIPSVTVIAEDAVSADIRATALSVTGKEGIEHLPRGIEALFVTGTEENYSVITTPGFQYVLAE